jgi:Domain of unknown function (DUF4865)
MIAKQYTVKLPADYDMGIIRRRVRERGQAFDCLSGLAFKAFLITELSSGQTANRYAPFYLWHDAAAINEFIYGEGFAGVAGSFGRPLIEHWIGLDQRLGDISQLPRHATREDLLIPDTDLAALRDHERDRLATLIQQAPGVYAATVALDPYRWQLMRFALWNRTPPPSAADQTTYDVLHLSTPALHQVKPG